MMAVTKKATEESLSESSGGNKNESNQMGRNDETKGIITDYGENEEE